MHGSIFYRLVALALAATGLSACSKLGDFSRLPSSGFTEVTIGRKEGARLGPPQNGGILVYAVDFENNQRRAARWLGPGELTTIWKLPNGRYRFFGLGYSESNLNSSTNDFRCGRTDEIALSGSPREVSLSISAAACEDTAFFQEAGSYHPTTKQALPFLFVTCAGGGGKMSNITTTGPNNVCDGGSWSNSIVAKVLWDQSREKIYVLGNITSYGGASAPYLMRLNRDGTMDSTFNTGTGFNSAPADIALDPNTGKLVAIGTFATYDGAAVGNIARLNVDGTLDTTFNPGTGFNSTAICLAIQSDGKIIAGGAFTSYNGGGGSRIVRINMDGSVDSSFNVGSGASGNVTKIAIQNDGKIMIIGAFTTFNGNAANRIARLNDDGTFDNGFFTGGGGFNSSPTALAVDTANAVWASGIFTTYNGSGVPNLVRLFSDGSRDTNANIAALSTAAKVILPLDDGKILIGGQFNTYNSVSVNQGLIRLNTDFTNDTTFNSGGTGADAAAGPNSLALDSNGMIVIGGNFATYNSKTFNYLARLNSGGSIDTWFGSWVPQASSHIGSFKISLLSYELLDGTVKNAIPRIQSSCITNTQGAHSTTDIRIPSGTPSNPAFAFQIDTWDDASCSGTNHQSRYSFLGGRSGLAGPGPNLLKTILPSNNPVNFLAASFQKLSDASWNWFFFREINQ